MNTNPIKDNSFDEIKIQKREAIETERYKEEKLRSWVQFRISVIISIIALLFSLASLVMDAVDLCNSNTQPNTQQQSDKGHS